MKKMIALLVALLMLALPFASAESALTISDPVVVVNAYGEETKIDLAGLALTIAGGTVGDALAMQVDIAGNGSKLYGITVNVDGERVLVTGDGLSSVYYVELPAEASSLSNLQIPEIDFEPILAALMSGVEMDVDSIKVSYTAVNDALAALVPYLEEVEVPGVDMSQFADIVNQLKESNSGINLEGRYSETETGMSLSAKGFLVQNGEASTEALFDLNASVGNTVSVTLNTDSVNFRFSLGEDTFAVGGSAQGTEFDLSGKYAFGESDVELVALDGSNAIDITALTDEQQQQAQNELMSAASGLIGYFFTVMASAAA